MIVKVDTMALDNEIKTKLGSKLWRLSHLYTIITKDNQKAILKLNFSQRKILTDFIFMYILYLSIIYKLFWKIGGYLIGNNYQ